MDSSHRIIREGACLDLSPKKIRALTMQNLYDLMDAITAKADQCVRDGVYFLDGELQHVTSAFMKSIFPQEGRRPYTPPEPETPRHTQGEAAARPLR